MKIGVTGVIPLGTTGESPTIDDEEADRLVERTVATVAGRVPIVVGVGSNDTRKVVKAVKRLQRHPVQGILSVCPYYNRPSQDGMREHFTRIAEATDRPILIYNIPYRTGVNLTNETLLRLAEIPNIAGVKDSSRSMVKKAGLANWHALRWASKRARLSGVKRTNSPWRSYARSMPTSSKASRMAPTQ